MALPPLKIVISATTTALDKSLTKTKANLAKFAKIAKAAMAAVASAVVAAAGALAVLAKRAFGRYRQPSQACAFSQNIRCICADPWPRR